MNVLRLKKTITISLLMAILGIFSSVAQSDNANVPKYLIPWTKMTTAEVKSQIIDPSHYDGKNKLGQPIVIVIGYYKYCGPCKDTWKKTYEDLNNSDKCIAICFPKVEDITKETAQFQKDMDKLTGLKLGDVIPIIYIIETDGTIYGHEGSITYASFLTTQQRDPKVEAFRQAYRRLMK